MKNNVLAVVGGTVALFGLGYLIYVVLGYHAMNGEGVDAIKGDLNIPTIILMEVLYATLITMIFSKWAQIKTFATGAKAGFIIGLFLGGLPALELFSTTVGLTDITGVLTGAVTFAVRFAVAGGVIGWLLGRD
jgi:Na+/H+ antiporter NhaC